MTLRHRSDHAAEVVDAAGQRVGLIAAPCPSRPQETFYPLAEYALSSDQLLAVATLMRHRAIDREYGS